MELRVTNSPFTEEQAELLNRLLPTLTEGQRIWLGGYLAAQGFASASAAGTVTVSSAPAAALPAAAPAEALAIAPAAAPIVISKDVTVLFGSQSGNSSGLSKKLAKKLEENGFQVTLSSMSDFKTNGLKKLQNLLIIVSTHGEGEPPDNAISFHEFMHSKRAPKLEGLAFSVLGLGDTSYEFFCQTAKDFDKRLEELGGRRIVDRVDCDVDYDDPARQWVDRVLQALQGGAASAPVAAPVSAGAPAADAESEYSRSNPFQAEVLENLNLNGRGSDRETRHVEISLEGSNLQYEPGDSLGVYPQNDPGLVDELIAAMGWSGDESVPAGKDGERKPLRDALRHYYEITVLTKPLLEQVAKLAAGSALGGLLEAGREQELRAYVAGRDVLDLVSDYALKGIPAGEFVAVLRKLPARLYSIASSSKAHPDEVHLTVRAVRYEHLGRPRGGVCSVHLAERVQPGDTLPVFIQSNPNFKLPADADAPIIMIGPGTGVAPFRAFLEEREETGAQGKSWLFYGDQHFATDFLYQIEWQRWLKDGVLSRLDVAFSRDTDQKVYVQHRMLEHSKELYAWLQEGAYVYVCGDEKKMAHDVHGALSAILQQEGGLTPEAAADYLSSLQQQKRYQRDVY